MSKLPQISPCPFCGDEAEFKDNSNSNGHVSECLTCKWCGARGSEISYAASDKKREGIQKRRRAILNWNTRLT